MPAHVRSSARTVPSTFSRLLIVVFDVICQSIEKHRRLLQRSLGLIHLDVNRGRDGVEQRLRRVGMTDVASVAPKPAFFDLVERPVALRTSKRRWAPQVPIAALTGEVLPRATARWLCHRDT